jgi:hypothetical protein
VNMSLPTRHVNLLGTKSVNLDAKVNEKVTNKNTHHEVYFKRETDENYTKACQAFDNDPDSFKSQFLPNYSCPDHPKDVSLHIFVSFYDKNWTAASKEYVPVYTPQFLYPVKVTNVDKHELFARAKLLQFKPGANPDNLLEGFDRYHAALVNFAAQPTCPLLLREQVDDSLNVDNVQPETTNDDDDLVPGGVDGKTCAVISIVAI